MRNTREHSKAIAIGDSKGVTAKFHFDIILNNLSFGAFYWQVLQHEAFRQAQRVSIYLSTSEELDTTEIIREMFRLEKMVFVPSYQGKQMKMVRLVDMTEYEGLPLTKWNIKQPDFKESREDAMTNGSLCSNLPHEPYMYSLLLFRTRN